MGYNKIPFSVFIEVSAAEPEEMTVEDVLDRRGNCSTLERLIGASSDVEVDPKFAVLRLNDSARAPGEAKSSSDVREDVPRPNMLVRGRLEISMEVGREDILLVPEFTETGGNPGQDMIVLATGGKVP